MPALDGVVREVRADRRFARLDNFASGTRAADGMFAAAESTLVMVRGVLPIVPELRALGRGRPQCSGRANRLTRPVARWQVRACGRSADLPGRLSGGLIRSDPLCPAAGLRRGSLRRPGRL